MIKNWLINYGINESMSLYLSNVIAIITIIIICMLANAAVKKFLMRAVKAYVAKSKNKWDDIILEKKVLQQIVGIVPGIIVYAFAPAFPAYESWIQRIASVYIVIIVLFAVHKLLNAIDDIYRKSQGEKARPIKGYLQVIEIIMFIIGIILIISFIINRSPWIMLSGIGAATAIGSLIFKDSILGLVASVQLTANDMVKLGDWIEMPSFGADGDVIDITLHTVKVQNWNKTISTIPTQALINQSFKNWSGMQESGGRRIKRHIYIDMNSIRFCTEEMLERFSKNPSLKEYMDNKKKDNGQLTNLGVFRAYLIEYLKNHPKLNKKMTMMVRQLQPTEKGLPIELYVFTDGTAWVNYEMIQWDIFEHIFAVLHEFDLRVYQSPSGYDLVNLRQ
ncbi:MAG: mechanosensitive ion channel family protein [Lutispora sp.]